MISNQTHKYDVAILGGGLAGLTLARQLLMKDPNTRIAVIEKRSFPVSETTHKVGESTVEIGAHYFSEELQLKKHLTDQQLPKFGLRFFFKDAWQSLSEGTEVGGSEFFAAPSYQVDRGRLENYLADADTEMGADIIDGARVRQISLDSSENGTEDTHHEIAFLKEGREHTVVARWVVDASGRASFLKRKLGLEEDLKHDINAVWFRIDASIQIDGWCDDDRWQTLTGKVRRRWLSTNHLMGEGYWVWLIPLATGSTSIGIVADPRIHSLRSLNRFDKAMAWLEAHEPECADSIRPYQDNVQDFLAIKKMSRGSRQVFSADRWGLVGEAAAFLDPFYSPGSDFIAIGNTMVGKLIEEDLQGHSIQQLAPTLQSVFLTLFQNNLLTYRDQYPLFGNPRIMALKFVWDYAVYWGFPALLYFNEKLTDVNFIQSLSHGVEEIRDMNLKMQEFFREWYEVDPHVNAVSAFVNQNEIEIMTRLNAELKEKLEDSELRNRFRDNVDLIRDLMLEITERVQQSQPQLQAAVPAQRANTHRLDHVFEMLNL
ncbi:MAG: tryptophan 7-halogenase [Pirellulaceae bacterium]|nr:tryptophan 7-halogenase [Pirellulaceae bacterium]MDG2102649.1 tryptophan 7-halogenase [Pirellulaceae bacterium]